MRPTCDDPQVPLVNNVSAQVVTSASAVREGLKQQVTAPVRWEESIRRLRQEGVELFVEVGPGKVLSGLVRQIDRAAECLRVEDSATLSEVTARWRRRCTQLISLVIQSDGSW